MKRLFVESSVFKKLIDGMDYENIERIVKNEILKDPAKGDVIKGTGGFRKIRIGKAGRGKSGGCRVIYLDVSEYEIVYLYIIFEKNFKVDLDSKEKKWLMDQGQLIKRGLKKTVGGGKYGSKKGERGKK